jgi:SnoaL-like polyketide cyclase
MSKESDNKALVGRWFEGFWGKTYDPSIVDELADRNMLLQYSLHEPRRGIADIKAFMADFRRAFPNLNFWGAADLIAEGEFVVGRWEGGGEHTGLHSMTSSSGLCPQRPVGKCTSPEPRCCAL